MLANVSFGSIASVWPSTRHFRSSPMNGHRRTAPAGPFRATTGLMQRSKEVLLDHFVRAGEQRGGNGEPERLCGDEIDAELETGRLLDRHVRWSFAFKDAVDIIRGAAPT